MEEEVAPSASASASFSRPTRINSLDGTLRPRNSEETLKKRLYLSNLRRLDRNQESHKQVDLVALETELRKAYVMKELQAQIAEKDAEKRIDRIRKSEIARSMELNDQIESARTLERRIEEMKEAENYKLALDEQLNRRDVEKWILINEERVERLILEEVDKIREESESLKKLENKEESIEKMMREKLIFDEMKEIRKEEELEAEEKMRLDQLMYSKLMDERREKRRKLKEENVRKRERVLLEIANSLVEMRAENSEREELLADLTAVEIKYELLLREEEEEERRRKMKADLAASLDEQVAFVERCKNRSLERDVAFAQELMKSIMEDERVAKFTAEARKRHQLRYRQDLLRLIQDRRRIRETEISRITKEIEEERELEKIMSQCVAEERKKLLMQHAPIVADFITKDVLTPDELRLVNQFRE